MVKIKKIRLQNYCGYKDTTFSFENDGKINNFSAFFGPNGCGKSTVLEAVNLLCNSKRFAFLNFQDEKERPLQFRKLTFNKEYMPGYEAFQAPTAYPMILTGWFDVDGKEEKIEINSHTGVSGELPYNSSGHVLFIDADNPLHMRNFQLHTDMADTFLNITQAVYGLKCYLPDEVKGFDVLMNDSNKEIRRVSQVYDSFYADFIIHKPFTDTKVHYKRMSAGEKKIATLVRHLCDSEYMNSISIITIDNAEMHIYFKRHMILVDKLKKTFPDKQFIVTTHSSVLVNELPKNELYDIEKYRETENV